MRARSNRRTTTTQPIHRTPGGRGTTATRLVWLLAVIATAVGLPSAIGAPGDQWDAWELVVCDDPNHMPFSNRSEEGLNNAIAGIIADELGAVLVHVWVPLEGFDNVVSEYLYRGRCDLVMGIQDGTEGVLATAAMYRSPYVLVYSEASDLDIQTLDDPALGDVTIGVASAGSPPHIVLTQQGHGSRIRTLEARPYSEPDPLRWMTEAVADGTVDVAAVWGPIGAYFGARSTTPLRVVPITPEVYPPFILMMHTIGMGVRPNDVALRDAIDAALASRWSEVQDTLERFGVPTSPIAPPATSRRGPR